MSGVVEFNMSDGLPPLVMQKLNANFKSLGNIDDLSGGKLLTGTVMPDNAADGAFFYNTETGDLSVWRNDGEQWDWSSVSSQTDVDALEDVITEIVEVATATAQHFWTDDSGVHVTDVGRDEWDEQAHQDDPFSDLSDEKQYHNILVNSLGLLLRSALNVLVGLTRSAISFYDGNDNDLENIVASFGADGAQIGSLSSAHIVARGDRMSFMNGDQEVAYIAIDADTNKAVFYMTRSVVVEDMYFGEGLWKWYKRSNNNMSLKWMGRMS